MAGFIVSNVFSIVAACAKNSYPSKAIFFPISHHLEQMESTTEVLYTGPWAHPCYWTPAWVGNLQAQIFPLFACSPHTGVSGKVQTVLLDHSGLQEKSWSQAVREKDQLSCCP